MAERSGKNRRRSSRKDSKSAGPREYGKKLRGNKKSADNAKKGAVSDKKHQKQRKKFVPNTAKPPERSTDEEIRLNKFIAHAGVCSRRDADTLIEEGKVSVNDKVVTEMGVKVRPSDRVRVNGQRIQLEPFVYLLMNKPSDTITTTDDENDRKTVIDLVDKATGQRLYPVGRLDRNTTGVLLLTNDGDLANRLMHPSYKVKKVYEVATNRVLNDEEVEQMISGIPLEDGEAHAKQIKRDSGDPRIFEMVLEEGRNRQIRRMIEFFGAQVEKLKRSQYAGLTVKGVKPGRWRALRRNEVLGLRRMVKLDPLDFN